MKQFADKIREYRTQNGLTQEQLAEKLFVSRQAVSKWEQGRGYPSMPVLESVAKLLNVTIDELIRSEEDEKLVLETNVLFGWRLKNHLAKKILLFLAPFLLNFIYLWVYTTVINSNYTLSDFENLEAYQAHIEVVANYIASAHFITFIPLIPLVLNIALYALTVAGILKPRTFKIVFLILNVGILIMALLSALIVCIQEGIAGLTIGLLSGCLLLFLFTSGIIAFFLIESSKAEKEIRHSQTIQKNIVKKLPKFLISAAFYVVYMAIFITVQFFSSAPAVRHNLLSSYGEMAFTGGLLIIVPAVITACLFLLVLMKKMHQSAFIRLMLTINIPTLFFALIYSLLPLLATGNLIMPLYFAIGSLLAIAVYIITLIICVRSAQSNCK